MKKISKKFLYSAGLSLMSLVCVSLFYGNTILLALMLVVTSVVMLSIWRGKEYLYLYIFISFYGALAESVAIAFGAWKYAAPDFIGITIWLPFLWGIAGLSILGTYSEIKFILRQ